MTNLIILAILAILTFALLPEALQKLGLSQTNSTWIALAAIALELGIFFLI